MLDLEPHRPRAWALAEHHVEREVLHGRVQDLLDHMAEPMDLVDEQDVAFGEAGEDRRKISGALDGRSRGRADLGTQLRGHDIGEGRLAEARWPIQQDVIDRFGPMARRVEQDRQVLLDPFLAGELVESARTDRRLERQLLGLNLRGADALDRHAAVPSTQSESNM